MDSVLRLCDIAPGEKCTVSGLTATGAMRRRLLDIGLVEHTPVYCIGKSPGGDPSAYLICGAVIAIRAADAATVLVER
ncbi:MAG: ferrous iron transport protein A [Clostridia bacterium]|nr:ferrous iron transport protein A [Clostridia bacterium]